MHSFAWRGEFVSLEIIHKFYKQNQNRKMKLNSLITISLALSPQQLKFPYMWEKREVYKQTIHSN